MKEENRKTFGKGIVVWLTFFGIALVWTLSGKQLLGSLLAQGNSQVNARQAGEFIDSLGINVHLASTATTYGSYDQIIKPRLIELGVRNLRDEIKLNDVNLETKISQLGSLGFKFQLISNPPNITGPATNKFIKKYNSVIAVEGPKSPESTVGTNWPSVTRSYQQDLYRAIKADPLTAHVKVVMPSPSSTDAYAQLGNLSPWIDYASLNNYYFGRNPGTTGWGANGYGSLTWYLTLLNPVVSGKPVISTESGWHNLVNAAGNHPGISEAVAGKYIPRLYLEHFRRGLLRTFAYELIDEKNDPVNAANNFGLLRYNGTPKPAFGALKNLVSLLRDDGPAFTPGRLGYTLSGALTDVRQVLLQKRDGTFYLAVWVEAANWDVARKVESPTAPRTLTLAFNSALTKAAFCVPNEGITWQNLAIRNRAISFTASDKVTLLRLK